MTKITEIGRDLKITTGGDNKIYSKCDIKNHSHDHFVQCGFEGGISFNNPEKPKTISKTCYCNRDFTVPELKKIGVYKYVRRAKRVLLHHFFNQGIT